MDTVKGDGVDGVNVLDSILLEPVALERILFLLNLLARVQVLHSHASLD